MKEPLMRFSKSHSHHRHGGGFHHPRAAVAFAVGLRAARGGRDPFGGDSFGSDPFGGDGPRGGGRGGRGGGRRRLFDNDALRLILLKLIADEPRHGYELIRAIEALSGEVYAPSPGVVYPTLTLLSDMELIVEQPGDGSRKRFAITDAGRTKLAEDQAALDIALERLAHLARKADRIDPAPVRRAMHNLRYAVQQRLEKEGADNQTMFDVAALIDEAAGKIERL